MVQRLLNIFLPLYIFLLPWQARYIFEVYSVGTPVYGDKSLYAMDVLFLFLLILWIIWLKKNKPALREQLQNKHLRLGVFAAAIILVFAALSLLWAPHLGAAYEKLFRLCQAFVLVSMIALGPVSQTRIIGSFLLSASVQGALAMVQFVQQTISASTWLGMAAQDPVNLGVSVVEYVDQRWLRAYGSLPHPNLLGGMTALASLLALAMYVKQATLASWQRVAYLAAFAFSFLGLLLSFSRSAWLGFAVGAVAMIVIGLWVANKEGRTWLAIGTAKVAVVAVLLLGVLTVSFGPLWTTRLHDESRLAGVSVSERAELMQQAREMIATHPWRGVGLSGYLPTVMAAHPGKVIFEYQPVHNTWLFLWAELGGVGLFAFAAWLAVILLALKAVWLKKEGAIKHSWAIPLLLALGIMFYFDHFWFSLPFGLLLAVLDIGVFLHIILSSEA